MPELPEVEHARRSLLRWMKGKTIRRAIAAKSRVLSPLNPKAFAKAVTGAKVLDVERRGKNLFLPLATSRSGGARRATDRGIRMHLGMTGKVLRRKKGEEPPRFSRVQFEMSDGALVHFCDMRLFGAVSAGPAAPLRERAFAGLGPDPLEDGLDAKTLRERLARTKRPLKIALMDQALLAGLGNIHAAEALWRAKLSPFRRADELSDDEAKRLATGILDGIRFALEEDEDEDEIVYVEEGGDNPFKVYDRGGEPCVRCRTSIEKKTQGGRTTYWCPACQPMPKGKR